MEEDPVDDELSDRELRQAAFLTWPRCQDPAWDHEDLIQEARLALWRKKRTKGVKAKTVVHRAMVDFLRKKTRWKGSGAWADMTQLSKPSMAPYIPGRDDPRTEPDLPSEVPHGDRLPPRFHFLARCLMDGWTRAEIAEALGVDPSRVTQLLETLRAFYVAVGWTISPDEG